MKKIIALFISLVPLILCAQQSWDHSAWSGYSWINLGNEGFTAGTAEYISCDFSPEGELYVAYRDSANNYKASVMKFDGSNWVYIGGPGFTPSQAQYISLVFNPLEGEPYIAFNDFAAAGKATVMKFDGTNWVNVGNPGFTAGYAIFTSLAFNPADMKPYVACIDLDNDQKATVLRFDGVNWVNVGNTGFSTGPIDCINLAFSPANEPYLAYVDYANSSKVTVERFDGLQWVSVGNKGFSPSPAIEVSLAFNPIDVQPYVAYANRVDNSGQISLMKFDGATWGLVGNENFSEGLALSVSLAFSPLDGSPFVAFGDVAGTNSGRASVMYFDGVSWRYLGMSRFSAGLAFWTRLAFSTASQPYIAFEDYANDRKATVMHFDAPAGMSRSNAVKFPVFPNPVSTELTIDLLNNMGLETSVKIENINGILLSETLTNKNIITINVSKYPSGLYFVRINNNYLVYTNRFIKN